MLIKNAVESLLVGIPRLLVIINAAANSGGSFYEFVVN
jgi:hypothetical protein